MICQLRRFLVCFACILLASKVFALSSSARREGLSPRPERLIKNVSIRIPEPGPFGDTFLEANVLAITKALFLNNPGGGRVESVSTFAIHLVLRGGFLRAAKSVSGSAYKLSCLWQFFGRDRVTNVGRLYASVESPVANLATIGANPEDSQEIAFDEPASVRARNMVTSARRADSWGGHRRNLPARPRQY